MKLKHLIYSIKNKDDKENKPKLSESNKDKNT